RLMRGVWEKAATSLPGQAPPARAGGAPPTDGPGAEPGPPQRWAPYRSHLRDDPRQGVDVWCFGEWERGSVTVTIDFHPAGRVEEGELVGEPLQDPAPLSRLRALLGW